MNEDYEKALLYTNINEDKSLLKDKLSILRKQIIEDYGNISAYSFKKAEKRVSTI